MGIQIIDDGGPVQTRIHTHADGKITFEQVQDVAPVLEKNKRFHLEVGDGYTPSREMRHVAFIPSIVLMQWAKEAGMQYSAIFSREFDEIIKRKLNDSNWSYLRTGGGVI
jgi:hypothetical protein